MGCARSWCTEATFKERELRKTIEGISTVPEHSPFGVALAFALDRLRDLVRRSFLARLCLASGTDPRWPFDGSASVDAALADEAERELWKRSWRDQLATLGAAEASEAAAGGIDPLAPQGP